ncbi:Uncharacterised protein [Mycoplasmopsis maculosa]|uniref:Uncharacterized protein n=1 Tax=Mycoplasmopsis maculosa TaxID=114885 RepID=A0A449B490_9BACT|nr:hypothetical protein [Mycoplasmopsis maculosa]VEU75421.1 Uncharacterised protein [Mycoplasmopsis maculosa]
MKNKILITSSTLSITSVLTTLSCSINDSNSYNDSKYNDEKKEINDYFSLNDFEYFKGVKNSIFESINLEENINYNFKNFVKDIKSFLDIYKNIINLELNKPYFETNNKEELNEINKELLRLDKLINNTYITFSDINSKTVEDIKNVYEKLLKINNQIFQDNLKIEKQLSYIFDNINNEKIKKVFIDNLENYYKTNFLEKSVLDLLKINRNLDLLNWYLKNDELANSNDEKIVNIRNRYENIDNLIDKNNIIESTLQIVNELINETKNYILSNNVILSSLKEKKNEVTNLLENKVNNFENSKVEELRFKISSATSLIELNKIVDEILEANSNLVDQAKTVSINKYESVFENNILNSILKVVINNVETNEELNQLDSKLENIKTVFEELKEKISSFNSNNVKGKTTFDFYKKMVDISNKFFENNLININLFDLENEYTFLSTSLNEIKEIINNDSSLNDQRSYEDVLREETQSVVYDLNPNISKIEKDKTNLYSANITLKNSDIFLTNPDTKYFDYKIYDLELENSNKNTLIIKYEVVLKSNKESKVLGTSRLEFQSNISEIIDNVTFTNIDQIFSIDYFEISKFSKNEWNNFNIDEQKQYIKLKNNSLSKYFTFDIIKNSAEIENKLNYDIQVKFNNQVIKTFTLSSENNIVFRNESEQKESYIDKVNKEKIISLINGNILNILELTSIKKTSTKTHSHYLASQVKEAFENEYELPKFGKYQLAIKDLISADNKNGSARVTFWYTENGNMAEITSDANLNSKIKKIDNFRMENFEDISPKNNKYFTTDDFNSTNTIPAEDLEIINTLDETNFDLRKAVGKVISDNKYIWYKSINPKNFLEQEAFTKLQYFFKLVSSTDNKGINLENEDYVPFNAGIYEKDLLVKNDTENINKLNNKYHIFYYDIKENGKRGLKFKVAFIDKTNTNIRYALNKEFSFINLVNDYEQVLYPEIILNNIKGSDLLIDKSILSSKTANEFLNNLEELEQAISINNINGKLIYKNFEFGVNNIKIAQIKKINNDEAFIRFKTTRQNWKFENNKVINFKEEILGNTWYKVTGFRKSEVNKSSEKLDFYDSNLNTVFLENNLVYRKRILEPNYKDLIWNLDKTNNVAYWKLDKKYLAETFFKNNAQNRKISFHFYANKFINDFNKTNRILSNEYGINAKIDFDDLISKGSLKQKINFSPEKNIPSYDITITFNWNNETGIEVFISLDNKEQKIIIDSPDLVKFENNQVYEANKAFLIMPAGVKTIIEYENNVEYEEFNQYTNQFNYNKVDYNQTNQPILFYNDELKLMNTSFYNPNQNVRYNLHNGYKMNADHIRIKEWKQWPLVNTIMARTMRYTNGTASMIGKLNNDPKDGRFYFLTNHHVQGMDDKINTWNDYSGEKFLKDYDNKGDRVFKFYFTVPYEYVGNNLLPGPNTDAQSFNYVGGYREKQQGFNVTTKVIWTGKEQLSKDGKKVDNADLSIVIWDINPIIKAMKRLGRFQVVKYLENWFKLPQLKFDFESSKYGFIPGPNIKDSAHIGFPLGDQTGYINHRPNVSEKTLPIKIQDDYSFVRITGGNSGSGFFIDDNRYISTLYGGILSKELYGRNYETNEYNYLGINWNNEDPLTLLNNRSFGSQILRANVFDPNSYDIPWFYKTIEK